MGSKNEKQDMRPCLSVRIISPKLYAEIDDEAWRTLYRDTSRPFEKPESGRFAVKVINRFGDEVLKMFEV